MRTRMKRLTVIACFLAAPSLARSQTTEPPVVPSSGTTTTTPPDPRKSADGALAAARELLDRIDAPPGDDPLPAVLDELNQRILDLQSADPANPWLTYLYGRAYAFSGRNGDAIDQLRRFVETRDGRNEWKAFRVLGDLFVSEFPRLAKANYERAAVLNPNEPSVLTGLSLCANKTGDRDEALRLARRAAEADGRRAVRFVHHLARTLASMKQWNEAEREALSALHLAEEGVRGRPGVRGPLQTMAAQYDLLIDIVGGRIGETAGAIADDYVRVSDYMARRAEVAAQLAKYDRLILLQHGMDTTGVNA
ncbi:MAG: tetratricopeptide repeat protein, partial [Phycisphaerales bacterium]|nr:tetratricopeptide repeat protein [Phycisphaerales bacterium]